MSYTEVVQREVTAVDTSRREPVGGQDGHHKAARTSCSPDSPEDQGNYDFNTNLLLQEGRLITIYTHVPTMVL